MGMLEVIHEVGERRLCFRKLAEVTSKKLLRHLRLQVRAGKERHSSTAGYTTVKTNSQAYEMFGTCRI